MIEPESQPPTESAPSSGWVDLPAAERNTVIGNLLNAEPMRRVWIVRNLSSGKTQTLGSLNLSLADSKKWLEDARQTRAKWQKKIGEECPHSLADHVSVNEQAWHVRYSDTPGGGWIVIEALRDLGCSVSIESTQSGWRVTSDDHNPHHGRVIEEAATMAEAACLVALRVLAPNEKLTDGGPKTL